MHPGHDAYVHLRRHAVLQLARRSARQMRQRLEKAAGTSCRPSLPCVVTIFDGGEPGDDLALIIAFLNRPEPRCCAGSESAAATTLTVVGLPA